MEKLIQEMKEKIEQEGGNWFEKYAAAYKAMREFEALKNHYFEEYRKDAYGH